MKITMDENKGDYRFWLTPENLDEAAILLRFANSIKKETPTVATWFESQIYTNFQFLRKDDSRVNYRIRDGKTS